MAGRCKAYCIDTNGVSRQYVTLSDVPVHFCSVAQKSSQQYIAYESDYILRRCYELESDGILLVSSIGTPRRVAGLIRHIQLLDVRFRPPVASFGSASCNRFYL